MIIIRRNIRGVKIRNYIYEDNPHPQSLAALLLLKRDYFRLDEHTVSQPWFEQLTFNTKFLEEQLEAKGDLICAYCGKKGLKIENPEKEFLATADHIKPKALGGDAFNNDNLAVACYACNSSKAAKMGYRISEDKCIFEQFPGQLNDKGELNG